MDISKLKMPVEHETFLDDMWECIVCFEQFATKTDLTAHLRTHVGLKSFRCVICGKLFVQNSQLIEHMKIHNNDECHNPTEVINEIQEPHQTEYIQLKNEPLSDNEEFEYDNFNTEDIEYDDNVNTEEMVDNEEEEHIRFEIVEDESLDEFLGFESDVEEYSSHCVVCCKPFTSKTELALHLKKHIGKIIKYTAYSLFL